MLAFMSTAPFFDGIVCLTKSSTGVTIAGSNWIRMLNAASCLLPVLTLTGSLKVYPTGLVGIGTPAFVPRSTSPIVSGNKFAATLTAAVAESSQVRAVISIRLW